MGHDLYARIPGKSDVVAHLRLSGLKAKKTTKIYEKLGVPKLNAIDSGNGKKKIFKCIQLSRLRRDHELTIDEQQFIRLAFEFCQGEGIEIEFA